MIRKPIRAVQVLLATLAIPIAMIAAAPTASAANPHLCETNGDYCLGVQPDISEYRLLTASTPGRDLQLVPLGGRYDNHPTFLIQFTAKPSLCVGTDNDTGVMIRACNGGIGIVWAQEYIGTTSGNLAVYKYINRNASNLHNEKEYLSGVNRSGSLFYTRPAGRSGVYYEFSWK
jgi:hypothetical protein